MEEIRARFVEMPFSRLLGVEVVDAADGFATMTMPLSPAVAWNDVAFAAAYVGLLADLACGAAAMSLLPADATLATNGVDFILTGATTGPILRAHGAVAVHDGPRLVLNAVVEVGDGTTFATCGAAMVTLRATVPR